MALTRKYATLRDSLKTGDLLLFAGKSFSSDSIKWVTLSPWSHVAMALVLPEYDLVCLWEATTDVDVQCLDRRVTRPGVQLVPLSERLRRYTGQVALRRLEGAALRKKDCADLIKLRHKFSGRPYEENTLELMRAAYDGPLGDQRENLRSLFCSELIAETYQALGLLRSGRDEKPSNEYVPADFSARHEDLPWQRGRLGPEITLKL